MRTFFFKPIPFFTFVDELAVPHAHRLAVPTRRDTHRQHKNEAYAIILQEPREYLHRTLRKRTTQQPMASACARISPEIKDAGILRSRIHLMR